MRSVFFYLFLCNCHIFFCNMWVYTKSITKIKKEEKKVEEKGRHKMSGYVWEIKHKTKVVGHAFSYDAACEIAYPHDPEGRLTSNNWCSAGITISPMLTDDANNYFEDLAKEFFGRDSESIDLSTLIRCGRWLDKHLFLTIDHNGSIWADDLFVGKVFRDDFRSIGDSAYERGDVE